MKFDSKYNDFQTQKWVWKCHVENGSHFCLCFNVLSCSTIMEIVEETESNLQTTMHENTFKDYN